MRSIFFNMARSRNRSTSRSCFSTLCVLKVVAKQVNEEPWNHLCYSFVKFAWDVIQQLLIWKRELRIFMNAPFLQLLLPLCLYYLMIQLWNHVLFTAWLVRKMAIRVPWTVDIIVSLIQLLQVATSGYSFLSSLLFHLIFYSHFHQSRKCKKSLHFPYAECVIS